MDKILIFAGTTEGRVLAEFLNRQKVTADVCVATEYGEELLPQGEYIHGHAGRLNAQEMVQFFRDYGFTLVIDATHPYAAVVSENIRNACGETGSEYVRLLRKETMGIEETEDVFFVDSVKEAVAFLKEKEGIIFAATGSKELKEYTAIPEFETRVVARVLSTPEVAAACGSLGFSGKNLICMQGPFSESLNTAMLQQTKASWMVTKEAGKAGGFEEKYRAAKAAGVKLVIVQRPEQNNSRSNQDSTCMVKDEAEVRAMLISRLGLQRKPQVSLIGIGMGNPENMTLEAKKACMDAEVLIGAERMLACAEAGNLIGNKEQFCEYRSENIAAFVMEHPEYEHFVVLLSGDVGFYSGAAKLYDALGEKAEIKVFPGISSVVYFCSRLHTSWEDVYLMSIHGRSQNLIGAVKHYKKVFAICGETDGIAKLCQKLLVYGLQDVKLSVGTDLSYPEEQLLQGRPEELIEKKIEKLSVVLVENPAAGKVVTHGIEDEAFLRDKIPMTKSEVRSISLSKLGLSADSVIYDVGAGTGSVSIEMAEMAWMGQVYAIEKKETAVALIKENKKKFGVDNLMVVEGLAPEAMEELPAPTHVFIGGSSGNLKEIMETALAKNPEVRIVLNAIALETVAEAMKVLKELPVIDADVVCATISKAKILGAYHMMMGQNPVYIISCTGGKAE